MLNVENNIRVTVARLESEIARKTVSIIEF